MKLPVELLPWVWAYREQLRLLDKHDAYYLRCAKSGDWSDNSRQCLLKDYSLLRGTLGAFLKSHSEKIWSILDPIFKPALSFGGDRVEELDGLWDEGSRRIGELMPKRNGGNPPNCRSMTAKLMSFYQPQYMTMFDKNARKALGRRSHSGFLREFESYYEANQQKISEVAKWSDRTYPYPRRVVDKRLWLMGTGEEDQILEQFKASLELAAIRPQE